MIRNTTTLYDRRPSVSTPSIISPMDCGGLLVGYHSGWASPRYASDDVTHVNTNASVSIEVRFRRLSHTPLSMHPCRPPHAPRQIPDSTPGRQFGSRWVPLTSIFSKLEKYVEHNYPRRSVTTLVVYDTWKKCG